MPTPAGARPTPLAYAVPLAILLIAALASIALASAGAGAAAEAERLRTRLESVLKPQPIPLEQRAQTIADELKDRETYVRVLSPDGPPVVDLPPVIGAAPDGVGLTDSERAAVLAGATVDVVRDEWLLVAAPIPGTDGPVGIALLATPVTGGGATLSAALPFLGLAALAFIVALGLGWVISRRAASGVPGDMAGPAAIAPSQSGPADPALVTAATDRDGLVRTIIEVRGQIQSVTLGDMLDRALATAGIQAVGADGELFDERRHRAVGTQATADRTLHDRIAATERPGYVDRGRLIRPPEVLVYQFADTGG